MSAGSATTTVVSSVSSVATPKNMNARIAADIQSFSFHPDLQDVSIISETDGASAAVSSSEVGDNPDKEKDKNHYKNFLMSSIDANQWKNILEQLEMKRQQPHSPHSPHGNTANTSTIGSGASNKRILTSFEQIALRLPKVATASGILRVSSAMSSSSHPTSATVISTEDFRSKVLTALEDWFMTILTQMSYSGASHFMAIILARDLEEGLYVKHFDEHKDELNREKYRSQQQMLMNNLRHPHNYHYVSDNSIACFLFFCYLLSFFPSLSLSVLSEKIDSKTNRS
jgi:hypothetical protein